MPANAKRTASEIAKIIRMVVFDVDGVMTDGGLHYDAEGRITKLYNVLDGVGIRLLQDTGVKVAVVTAGQDGACVEERMKRLKVDAFYQGNVSKQEALEDLSTRFSIDWKEMAYLGDDWVDLVPMAMVGLPIAVPNAREAVRNRALFVTQAAGGHGAVREVAEWLITCQGNYEGLLARWSTPVSRS